MAPKVSTTSPSCRKLANDDLQPASTAGKAPASTASKAPAKSEASKATKAAKKTAAKSKAPADGEKKKRKKARKETYSSYIYKGLCSLFIGNRDNAD